MKSEKLVMVVVAVLFAALWSQGCTLRRCRDVDGVYYIDKGQVCPTGDPQDVKVEFPSLEEDSRHDVPLQEEREDGLWECALHAPGNERFACALKLPEADRQKLVLPSFCEEGDEACRRLQLLLLRDVDDQRLLGRLYAEYRNLEDMERTLAIVYAIDDVRLLRKIVRYELSQDIHYYPVKKRRRNRPYIGPTTLREQEVIPVAVIKAVLDNPRYYDQRQLQKLIEAFCVYEEVPAKREMALKAAWKLRGEDEALYWATYPFCGVSFDLRRIMVDKIYDPKKLKEVKEYLQGRFHHKRKQRDKLIRYIDERAAWME